MAIILAVFAAEKGHVVPRFKPTEADRAACEALIKGLRNDGSFMAPSESRTLVYPGDRLAATVRPVNREDFEMVRADWPDSPCREPSRSCPAVLPHASSVGQVDTITGQLR